MSKKQRMKIMKTLLEDQKGQGMVEYGLILAAVAVAVFATATIFGSRIASYFNTFSRGGL